MRRLVNIALLFISSLGVVSVQGNKRFRGGIRDAEQNHAPEINVSSNSKEQRRDSELEQHTLPNSVRNAPSQMCGAYCSDYFPCDVKCPFCDTRDLWRPFCSSVPPHPIAHTALDRT